jgi:hypothetical protein
VVQKWGNQGIVSHDIPQGEYGILSLWQVGQMGDTPDYVTEVSSLFSQQGGE